MCVRGEDPPMLATRAIADQSRVLRARGQLSAEEAVMVLEQSQIYVFQVIICCRHAQLTCAIAAVLRRRSDRWAGSVVNLALANASRKRDETVDEDVVAFEGAVYDRVQPNRRQRLLCDLISVYN
eukprot:3314754-Amphidinium_carterae.1